MKKKTTEPQKKNEDEKGKMNMDAYISFMTKIHALIVKEIEADELTPIMLVAAIARTLVWVYQKLTQNAHAEAAMAVSEIFLSLAMDKNVVDLAKLEENGKRKETKNK